MSVRGRWKAQVGMMMMMMMVMIGSASHQEERGNVSVYKEGVQSMASSSSSTGPSSSSSSSSTGPSSSSSSSSTGPSSSSSSSSTGPSSSSSSSSTGPSSSPSSSSSSSSSAQDGPPRNKRKRDVGNFKRFSRKMEVCGDASWGYWYEEVCDGVAHCPDAFDELECPCDLLLPPEYKCDGYFDCPDLSDERGCTEKGCSTGEHRCGGGRCVGAEQVCDGVDDCRDGTDEAFCWRLSPTALEVTGYVSRWSEGYLQVRRGGAWLPVCVARERDPRPLVTKYCDEVVGEARYNTDSYVLEPVPPSSSANTPGWALYGGEGVQVRVEDRCDGGKVIKVTCGTPTCANETVRAKRMLVNSSKATKEEEEEEEEEEERGTKHKDEREDEENEEEKEENKTKDKQNWINKRNKRESEGKKRSKEEEEERGKMRVVGGTESEPFKYPFIVAIFKNGVFSCGGSIVSASVILTAAHCVGSPPHSDPPALYEVQAGMFRRNSWSPYEQSRRVAKVTLHPKNNRLENDVALFILATPLQLNRWVRPVCLAKHLKPQKDHMCTVAGWGTLKEGGKTAVSLREVELPVLSTCMGDTHLGDHEVLCAGHPLGQKDACQGDSGGPLMCIGSEEGWVQAGVVSFGEGCARAGNAGVYGRITHYHAWIIKSIGGKMRGRTGGATGEVTVKQVCGGVTCRLTGGTCLPIEKVCDGKVDCLEAEDEMNCMDSGFEDEIESENRVDDHEIESENRVDDQDQGHDEDQDRNYNDDDYYDYYDEGGEEEGMNYRSNSIAKDSSTISSRSSIPETVPSTDNADSSVPDAIPEAEVAHSYIPNPEIFRNPEAIPSPENGDSSILEAIPSQESPNSSVLDGIPNPEVYYSYIPSPETYNGYIPKAIPRSGNIPEHIPKVSSSIGYRARTGGDVTSSDQTTAQGQDACAVKRVTVGEVLQELERILCSAEEFLCTDVPECVPAASRCDGSPQCVDGSDERACGCKARLEAAGRGDLLCDGHPDCADLTDEDCEPCDAEAPFHCARSGQCVKVTQLCDTRKDCTHGEDEMDCLALYNRTEVQKGVVEGTLMLKEGTTWHSLCLGSLPTHLGTHVCKYIGYSELGGISYIQAPSFAEPEPRRAREAEPRARGPEDKEEGRGGGEEEGTNDDEGALLRRVLALREDEDEGGGERGRRGNEEAGEGKERERRGNEETGEGGERRRRKRGDDNSEESLLKKIQGLKGLGQARASTCQQAVLRCEREACGKAALYYYDKVTPVAKAGGVPWAGCVQVNGRCACGGTLISHTWVLTSTTCMADVSLAKDIVVVVMGSVHRVGAPTRVLGGHEAERRVGRVQGVEGTDMLLLRLADPMPRTDYVNSLCLPRSAPALGVDRRCVVAGVSEKDGRESVGLLFSPREECEDDHLCPDARSGQEYCTESWSGVVACQQSVETNPTWEGVGVWAYQRGAGEGAPCRVSHQHPLLTDAHLTALHLIMDTDEAPSAPATPVASCEGRICATGVCVGPGQDCDGTLDCPDLSDEPPTCPPLVTTCLPVNTTDLPPSDLCECPAGRWACLSGTCIPMGSVCDGVKDCPGGEDEEDCSCCKVLRLKMMPEKICDGKLDCDDQTDEENCDCPTTTTTTTSNATTNERAFRCYRSSPQSCVGRRMVCDGNKDCGAGEDERNCITLAPNVTVVEDALGRPTTKTPSGYLLVKLAGTWYTYANEMWDVYLSHLICLQLGYFMANVTEAREIAANGVVLQWEGGEMVVEEVESGVVEVVWIECDTEKREIVRRSISGSSSSSSSSSSSLDYSSFLSALIRMRKWKGE
ncbi:serine protease nudel-like isoform X2 [Eriocheir sinensis]|uniref:serine protease nudel-like isoform X2 n=1 Tax=Eriocheir sinensis TaxID=95602 RepID=UPI0021C5A067|nr:serine protease nudel-like isoform X2 [Eriocheir sinensis]